MAPEVVDCAGDFARWPKHVIFSLDPIFIADIHFKEMASSLHSTQFLPSVYHGPQFIEILMEEATLASLSLTHVRYNPNDPISYASAWLALVPQGLCVVYVTLIWASREVEVLLMFIGQMGCEALNFILKRWIREERPKQMYGKGYGMPSSHAQFVAFFAVSLSLFLLLRHVPSASTSYSPSTFPERALLSFLTCCCASAVAASRIYLNYHTSKQVLVGVAAGASTAMAWFLVTTILRRYGWLDWALENPLARMLRMRDLVTTEDLVDAGWGRFELRRKARQAAINGDMKKAR